MTALIITGSVRRFCRRTLFEQGYHRGICFAPRPGLLPPRQECPPENAVIPEVTMPEGYPLIRFSSAAPV